MKAVNKNARKVLNILTARLDDDFFYRKVNRGASCMAVSVEKIGELKNGTLFSVAHYLEQNGDLRANPKMVFLKTSDDNFYPIYFRADDFLRADRCSAVIKENTIAFFYPKLQREDALFASSWVISIKQQQNLKPSSVL